MKKVFTILFALILFFADITTSNAMEETTGVTFIYINGSNNLAYKNRLKFKVAFVEDVKKLHPQIKKRFEEDELIREHFLKKGRFTINEEPLTFYWGDRSLNIVESLDRDLKASSKYSPKIAHQARSIFAHCLHDAVWVQKPQNMTSVINDLHKIVKAETDKGNKVVLLGYSAGSFVTYQYYLNKSTSIYAPDVTKGKYDKDVEDFISNTPVLPTCFDALTEAHLIKYNPETGKYIPNPDLEVFKRNYKNLDNVTQTACFANGTVKGVVGFASPARLFYSDFMDSKTSINYISRLMSKSIVENDVFYLTVNYSNDPFGFSNSENFTYKNLQNNNDGIIYNSKFGQGFIYNKSNNYVPRTFVTAHLAYWDTPKRFAKTIVKAYNEGYSNFYGYNK